MQKLSRREREKQNRRDEILRAAWEIFASKDYNAATIDDIAAAAELSKGTVYLYFQNKADLFLSTLEMGLDKVSSVLQEVVSSSDDPVSGLKQIVECMLGFFEENLGFFKIMSSEQAHFDIHTEMMKDGRDFKEHIHDRMFRNINIVANHIQRGIEMGVFRQVNPQDVAISLLEMIRGFIVLRLFMDIELAKKAESITSILLDGIRKNDQVEQK